MDGTLFLNPLKRAIASGSDQENHDTNGESKKLKVDNIEEEEENEEKNEILFLTNLPPTVTEDSLQVLFQQYPGFKEGILGH